MGKDTDTIKVELVTDYFTVSKTNDNVIIIEQKDKEQLNGDFIESPMFTLLIVPLLILVAGFFLNRLWYWRKEKKDGLKVQVEIDKLRDERNKIKEETTQIKKSFQPIVLSTLMQSQEFYRGDKVKSLKEIVNYRTEMFYIEQFYHDGQLVTDDVFEYYSHIYRGVSNSKVQEFGNIINEFGYLFPDIVINKMNDLLSDISSLNNIWNREASSKNMDMPNDAETIMEKLGEKFEKVITLIREDLHVDNGFINEFIEKYKTLNQ